MSQSMVRVGTQALGERGAAMEEIAGGETDGSEVSLRSETANVDGAVFNRADSDVAILKEGDFHNVVNGAAEVGLEPEKTVASWSDGLAAGGEDHRHSLGGVGPVLANHLRACACRVYEDEAEQREDGRRKEFAADLVPREGRLLEDLRALTHAGKCGHQAGRASAPNMDRPHQRSS
jgi:hypothetical protein